MRVKIRTRFATAKATARALGVPRIRAEKLAKLVDSPAQAHHTNHLLSEASPVPQRHSSKSTFAFRRNGRKFADALSTVKSHSSKIASASRKRQSRVRISKASR